jgi:catechol 2,3-dioxygenase-like lactoylglutathione lyase family enzyme
MDWKLEVVVLPAADVDRSKKFYSELLVQLTPPGSACSVTIGTGLNASLQLVVADIEAAHAELVGRGVEVSNVQHMEDGVWADGRGGPWNSFFFFTDLDGNDWAVQEKPGM